MSWRTINAEYCSACKEVTLHINGYCQEKHTELKPMNDTEEIICETCGFPAHPCLPCSEIVAFNNHVDDEYFGLLRLILEEGKIKKNRTGVDTIGVFGAQAKFDVDMDAFPILTTKKVWFKGIVHELLWFLKGDTNIKYLVDNDVHIWDEWAYKRYANTPMDELIANRDVATVFGSKMESRRATLEEFIFMIKTLPADHEKVNKWGELGEGTYGGMWRKFPYYSSKKGEPTEGESWVSHAGPNGEYALKFGHVDQLTKIVDKLRKNPDDRRMIVSAWHPYWVDHCALPPCHCLFHFNTEELTLDERVAVHNQKYGVANFSSDPHTKMMQLNDVNIPTRKLNLLLYQRSCDTFLGVPFNITSYSLLLAMVAHCVDMVPGVFTHTYGDLHIYQNHREQVDLQMSRLHRKLPKLWLNPQVKDLFKFKFEDIRLEGYDPHPAIKGEIAV